MRCNGCGNDNPPGSQFCGFCGQAMPAIHKTSRIFIWVSFVLLILGLIALIAGGIWFFAHYTIVF